MKAIKKAVSIPVVANGDITSVEKAEWVLDYTGADAIMVGRAAQGRPSAVTTEPGRARDPRDHRLPPADPESRPRVDSRGRLRRGPPGSDGATSGPDRRTGRRGRSSDALRNDP